MRIHNLALIAPLFASFCSFPGWSSSAHAQETLGGLGAASGMGATLGAAAAGSAGRMRGAAQGGAATGEDPTAVMMDPQFPNGPAMGAPGQVVTTQTTVTRTVTPLAGRSGSGGAILGQLLARPFRPIPEQKRRSARGQAAYSRNVSRLSAKGRKKLVLGKYKIAPRGYLASYLPQDRYKFAKAWKFVSTETDQFYYRPQDMSRRGFNANRVIGFRTWQDAMLAGYRPDPISKPEPGNQLAFLASLTRDEPLVQYVEYIYTGQVSPASVTATTNYVRRVKTIIDRNPRARQYQRETVNSILMASLTGDASQIPTQLGVMPLQPAGIIGNPQFPTATVPGGPPPGFQGPPPGFQGPPPGFQGPPPGFQGPPPGFQPPPRGFQGPPPGAAPS